MGETRDGMGRSWTVWGDSSEPIQADLTEGEAREEVDRLVAAGQEEVYADCHETGRIYEP